ncbi:MAG: phosphonoacetate hydrolase [Rhodospirillales bacterium]|jgi:phosphonoacetate hydrolase|nr:phosphonoacetate hydrolase [Rhodospirillales bacterium]
MKTAPSAVEINGRHYQWPKQPIVVVCIDGSEPGYIEQAAATGRAPFFQRILEKGTNRLADCVVPSFTNPNNLSIVTGVAPEVHGICGNFFYDRDDDAEVMMNEPRFLRVETIFKAFQDEGAKIVVITAKDKLRRLLGHGLTLARGKAASFSSEKADEATIEENGITGIPELVGLPVPSVYSAELSAFVFAAGVKLMERDRPDIMYLSTTDYIQHKHAPGTPVANDFYVMMDGYLEQLEQMGCLIALTADHGMNAKHDAETGEPNVFYLQDWMDERLGSGAARVILPITDPYVVHHGALGSFATVYIPEGVETGPVIEGLLDMEPIDCALTRAEGCKRFGLPEDRMGDLIVVSTKHTTLGTSADRHDLSGLTDPLRSHGGTSEQRVPLLGNRAVSEPAADAHLRNFDIFDLALNKMQ